MDSECFSKMLYKTKVEKWNVFSNYQFLQISKRRNIVFDCMYSIISFRLSNITKFLQLNPICINWMLHIAYQWLPLITIAMIALYNIKLRKL